MLSYNRSVIPIIESAYEELTNVEKNIPNYFIDQVEDEDLSSKAVLKDYMYLKHPYHGLLKS